MRKVFLSPSSQEYNLYLTGGSEQQYMNMIADRVEQMLLQNNFEVGRNDRNADFNDAIHRSNRQRFDLHVAIHSNASPPNIGGSMSGPVIFYYPDSKKSICAAIKTADRFKKIYPDPDKVAVLPSETLAELRKTKAPAVYIETAYHDNPKDEAWIKQNVDSIALEISNAITDFFDSCCGDD